MLSCYWVRRELSLSAALPEDSPEARGGKGLRLARHLESCSACRKRLADLRRTLEAVREDPLLAREDPVDWDRLREATVARALAEDSRRSRRELRIGLAFAATAVLALVLAGIWASAPAQLDPGATAFLERMERSRASMETASYLDEGREVLLGVLSPLACPESAADSQPVDVSLERRWSRELLFKRRLLQPALERPELARALPVAFDLDVVLLEVAGLPDCAPPERLAEIGQLVRSRDLLLRLELVAGEL
jgi:hypothetical protein